MPCKRKRRRRSCTFRRALRLDASVRRDVGRERTSCSDHQPSSTYAMLASKLIARSCLKQNLSAAAVVQPCRTYALSRFPHEKRPGSGRARERVVRVPPRQRRPTPEQEPEPEPLFNFPFFNLGPKESKPSAEESPLWEEASQRAPPSGNSTEGLSRLLMDNNVLVVTRYALPSVQCTYFQ